MLANDKVLKWPILIFYSRNLLIFVISMPFQPSIMFAGKAGAYLSEALVRRFTLGLSLGLTHKH